MFRIVSILGLVFLCIMTAAIFGIFDFRIAVDDSWTMAIIVFVVFLGIALLASGGVYLARRRERIDRKEPGVENIRPRQF